VRLTVLAHVAAMLAGSALTASALVATARLLGPLPAGAVCAVCLLGAAVLLGGERLRLPGSHWMVPRSWARFGHNGYAALFGLALGSGVATLLPSAGWYGLLAAAQATPPWWGAFAVMLCFGATRGALVPLLTARSAHRGEHPVTRIEALGAMSHRLVAVEALLLAALAVQALRT
jgi:hypothetical protein